MAKEKVSIKFPDNAEFTPAKEFQENTKQRFDKIDNLLIAVVASVVIATIGVVVSVVGIFIDQLRFNNAAYTDYTNRIQNTNDLQKANKALLQQISNQQNLIISQQKVIERINNK